MYIEVIEEPDYLEFEENECFTISPMKITEDLQVGGPRFWKNGATVTIECIKAINVPTAINIFACKKDEIKGAVVKKVAGRLWVWENAPFRIKEAKILLIKVTTPPFQQNLPPKIGNYTANEKNNIGKYLKQTLIITPVEEYAQGLDLSKDNHFKQSYTTSNIFDTIKQKTHYMDDYLYKKLQDALIKAGKNINTYDNYYRIFFVGGKDKLGCAAYGNGRNVVVYDYPNQPDATLDHELLHLFKLSHSFSNKECSSYYFADYTYKARNTENIMDYSYIDGNKCYDLWHWQWERANSSVL